VRFQAGARTHWHTHTGEQVLIVVEGTCIVKREGSPAVILKTGEAIRLPANEKHWHGAVSDSVACHLAVNINFTTAWLEPVSEENYRNALREVS
jgi:quercetin dioxygenase-like cupin family protein